MGFKKISSQKNEEDFLNSARGETSETKIVNKKTKRNKSFLLYFTEDELEKVRNEAARIGMGINQYIRFKVFNNIV
ncbi:hypothetical protein [Campylobacter sp. RM16192]|uniref:hypothetical protein n=1 Tax=Campylobacter sp. RM16192 TaxID=1660080 RepID=UPI00159B62B0|nr:hypothetical protein [Campylobacter sp. RM16192]QKU36226.1 hypothetical protein CDOMC_a013 [Campylobacter sp. RM16192]